MPDLLSDDYFMQRAIAEAVKALDRDEVPVGAVVVANNRIIARGFNRTETLTDVTAHAEMEAITAASNFMGGKYLTDCTLYVTLEPCVMCAGAIAWARFSRVVYGASDEKRGFIRFGRDLLHPKTTLKGGVMEEECSELLIDFFKRKR